MIYINYIFKNGETSQESPEFLTFSGGEEHVKIKLYPEESIYGAIQVLGRIKSSQDFMRLVLTLSALKNNYKDVNIHLFLPYLPYARQDRVCSPGQAFSLEVVANILNSFELDKVFTIDVHNASVAKLIDNLENSVPVYLARKIYEQKTYHTIVIPDEGAKPRAEEYIKNISRHVPSLNRIQVEKKRDPDTGKIVDIKVPECNVSGHNCLIIDDICDGGGTFIPIALGLKEQGASSVGLYVTHGIFSNGIDYLLENGINMIYTTNSFCDLVNHPKVKILHKFI